AEDGIRDRNVTGVQTCALPISNISIFFCGSFFDASNALLIKGQVSSTQSFGLLLNISVVVSNPLKNDICCFVYSILSLRSFTSRSEERRVGKECRLVCWQYEDR